MDKRDNINIAINYIEDNIEADLSVQDLSQKCGLSNYHFQRVFQSIVGDPVSTYIRNRRLTNAAFKLLNTKNKIVDIALDSCFNSHEAFIHSFKDYFSMTPGIFRDTKPAFIPYTRVDVYQDKNCLESNNLEFNRYKYIEDLNLIGIEEIMEFSDFSISKEIIRKGKRIFSNSDGNRYYYCISNLFEKNSCNYFIGLENLSIKIDEVVSINFSDLYCMEFKFTGITRSISEALIYLKDFWFPSKSIRHKGIFIEKHPICRNKSNYVSTILIPV